MPTPEERFIGGFSLVVLVQNQGRLPFQSGVTVEAEALLEGERITATGTSRQYMAAGAIAPVVVQFGRFRTEADCPSGDEPAYRVIPPPSPTPGNPLPGIPRIVPVDTDRPDPSWPFRLASGDAFRFEIRLDPDIDTSPADNALTLEGTLGGDLELVLAPPRVHGPGD